MELAARIVYEDNHLLVVNKLPGELVQGDRTGDLPLLEKVRDYIRNRYQKPGQVYCGLIHRLDRPTSGLVAFAKTSKALARMNALFEQRAVRKDYFAITQNPPPEATMELKHFLRKDASRNKSVPVAASSPGAKEARMRLSLAAQSQRYYLLKVELMTGRHHQIRAQLAAINCPIKGDLKYGFDRSNMDASIGLHAGCLAFEHPIKKERIELSAPCLGEEAIWRIFNPYIACA